MSSVVLDDFATGWQAEGSALWTITTTPARSPAGLGGADLQIDAVPGSDGDPPPSALRSFATALDLRDADELRVWLRSSRPASGAPASPFYLALEAATDVAATPAWRRLLPVQREDAWELHCLWLGDMATELREAVGVLRLRSLDPTIAFRASLGGLVATRPEPIRDVDDAFVERLDTVYSVPVGGTQTTVPAIVDVPENPGSRTAPYVLITPWSVLPMQSPRTATEIVDNFTPAGAHTRPARRVLKLEYRIDAFVTERAQKSHLLERIVADLAARRLLVGGELLEPLPFEPAPIERPDPVTPGRTPLFYRVLAPMEAGPRQFHAHAVPVLSVDQSAAAPVAQAVAP